MKTEKVKTFFKSRTGRSLVIAAAVLLIGLAVYLNYQWFYDPLGGIGYGDGNMDDRFDNSQQAGADAEGEENNYFTSAALTRQASRDEAVEVLKLVTENAEASEEAKAEAAAKISAIAVTIQNESNIERLVKAKGFEECIAIIGDDSVSVIVKAEELQAAQAAQILAIAYETTGISPENISIITKQ